MSKLRCKYPKNIPNMYRRETFSLNWVRQQWLIFFPRRSKISDVLQFILFFFHLDYFLCYSVIFKLFLLFYSHKVLYYIKFRSCRTVFAHAQPLLGENSAVGLSSFWKNLLSQNLMIKSYTQQKLEKLILWTQQIQN